jgi:hypothetical protein
MKAVAQRKITALPGDAKRVREALLAAGIEPAPEQVDVDICIAIVPRTDQRDIGDVSALFLLDLIERLRHIEIKSSLTWLNIFPTLVSKKNSSAFQEGISHRSKYTSVSVAKEINLADWKRFGHAGRVDLFAKNLSDSITWISDKALSDTDRKKLLELVEKARRSIGGRAG